MSVAEFVQKTWDMVSAGHEEIQWSDDGTQIVVFNAERLAASNKLKESSNTTKFESWVRRLSTSAATAPRPLNRCPALP